MTTTYDCTSPELLAEGLDHAQRAISEKKCIVMPTDTVYGIAADAFSPLAVTLLLASKGRSRQMPPPVLIPRLSALDGLATDVPDEARKLAAEFWPGGLTLILHAQPSLSWDLGETKGTVALRIPADDIAQALLERTGPLAVSSANRTGQPPAQTAEEARAQLAESVEVYLEGGTRPAEGVAAVPSTIVDATSVPLRVVRQGAIALERLRDVVPDVLGEGETATDQVETDQVDTDQVDTDQSDTAEVGTVEAETPSAAGTAEGTVPDTSAGTAVGAGQEAAGGPDASPKA